MKNCDENSIDVVWKYVCVPYKNKLQKNSTFYSGSNDAFSLVWPIAVIFETLFSDYFNIIAQQPVATTLSMPRFSFI